MTKIGVITFPGSLDDVDAQRAVRTAGATPVPLWHGNDTLGDVDAVILPGGFSYGDYLRCGAIARFSPIMSDLITRTQQGLPVLGICNGFQVLCEAHLLPGALIRNDIQTFVCRDQHLIVGSDDTVWTAQYDRGQVINIVLKNGEGGYVADAETLARLEGEDQVVFRYADSHDGRPANPNGSLHDIAGITNARGNVVGLMPHPEHNVDPLTGPSTDGAAMFASLIAFVESSATSRSLAGVS